MDQNQRLKRRKPIRRVKRIRRIHPETRYNLEAYLVFKPCYLKHHPYCQFGGACMMPATEIHHIKGRGHRGSLLTDERFLMAICGGHHRWIHDNPKRAREMGALGF